MKIRFEKIEGDETKSDNRLPVHLADNARSLGAHVIECYDYKSLTNALRDSISIEKSTVIYTKCVRYQGIDGYGWWEVPTAEISEMKIVDEAHKKNLEQKKKAEEAERVRRAEEARKKEEQLVKKIVKKEHTEIEENHFYIVGYELLCLHRHDTT